MQLGLFMMPLHPPYRGFAESYQRDIDQIVLVDQLFIRVETKQKVSDVIATANKTLGAQLQVTRFARLKVGESAS